MTGAALSYGARSDAESADWSRNWRTRCRMTLRTTQNVSELPWSRRRRRGASSPTRDRLRMTPGRRGRRWAVRSVVRSGDQAPANRTAATDAVISLGFPAPSEGAFGRGGRESSSVAAGNLAVRDGFSFDAARRTGVARRPCDSSPGGPWGVECTPSGGAVSFTAPVTAPVTAPAAAPPDSLRRGAPGKGPAAAALHLHLHAALNHAGIHGDGPLQRHRHHA